MQKYQAIFFQVVGLGCLLLSSTGVPVFSQQQPPKAEVRNVTDDYFGQKIVDPYRWMENSKSDETQRWMKEQADYADQYLQQLPTRAAFLKRLEELSAGRNAVGRVKRFGNRLFYQRFAKGDKIGKMMMRSLAAGGAETVLIDLDKLSADGKSYSIGGMTVSPNGKYLAYEIFSGGSEIGEIRVLEIATGKHTSDKIGGGATPQSWLPDSKSFTYARNELQPANAKPEQEEEKKRIRQHRLGTDVKTDREIFGYGVNPEIKFPLINDYAVTIPSGSKYAFGWVNPGVTTNYELYYAPVTALESSNPIKWRKIGGLEDEIFASAYQEYKIGVRGDDLYLATTKNTPQDYSARFKKSESRASGHYF
jgi:prolyl oligopeptidase